MHLVTILLLTFAFQATALAQISFADDTGTAACTPLFGAQTSAVVTSFNGLGLNSAEVCGAYQDLVRIYRPGGDSRRCIQNVEIAGITGLNPNFALRLNRMLKAASSPPPTGVGRQFYMNSAYRNACAQGSANPVATSRGFVSMHQRGLAVDLIYPGGGTKYDCSSAGYQWIIAHAREYGIAQYNQVHSPVSGECNHIENTTGVTRTPGPGASSRSASAAPLGLGNLMRGLFGSQQPLPHQSLTQPLTSSQPITSAFAQPSTSLLPQTNTQTQTQTNASNQIVTNTNTNINENTSTGSSSPTPISNLLQELAFGTNVATSGRTATSVPLVITGAQAGTLAYVEGQQPQEQSTADVGGIAPVGEQTFTSGTLSTQGFDATTLTPQETAVLRTLTTLRALLYTLLDYLRPFGGGRAPQIIYE